MSKKNVIIIGAAGRDFHNFNTYYRNNDAYNVVAFTAAQIPDIAGRRWCCHVQSIPRRLADPFMVGMPGLRPAGISVNRP